MKFSSIKKFSRSASYNVHVGWDYVDSALAGYNEKNPGDGLDLDPDFQRAHVWDEEKQRRFVEFILRGGHSSRDIYFNHPNWNGSYEGQMVLVDGKQRLEAARKFLRNELAIFGGNYFKDFTDKLPWSDVY